MTEVARIIAGDSPLLWAMVIGVLGLVSALGLLWRAYQERNRRVDHISDRTLKALEASAELRSEVTHISETVRSEHQITRGVMR